MSKSTKATGFSRRHWVAAFFVAASTVALAVPALAQEAGDALPPGPKETLAHWAGDDVPALKGALGETRTGEEWRAELSGISDPSLLAALADYLGLNGPFADAAGDDVASVVAGLPLDGKELFLQDCLSCHGGNRHFLQQDKSFDEWMGIFDAPYHRRLMTEGVERETFASYAAETTPLALETLPEELRDREN